MASLPPVAAGALGCLLHTLTYQLLRPAWAPAAANLGGLVLAGLAPHGTAGHLRPVTHFATACVLARTALNGRNSARTRRRG
ncbi:hypothetical protein ACBJ59_58665 [Nonomuraea sp. MTCD27]|uniref:hypothetical protein n=1 Tax=Nonomuraea sp. MTCD27 TaxID=1676747 RepID=UPI0035BF79DA